jgi:hypothetical protein
MNKAVSKAPQRVVCSVCLDLGASKSSTPGSFEQGFTLPILRHVKQSAEIKGCPSCKLLLDALNSYAKPQMFDSDDEEHLLVRWTPGRPLRFTFYPDRKDERCVDLDIFARDGNVQHSQVISR